MQIEVYFVNGKKVMQCSGCAKVNKRSGLMQFSQGSSFYTPSGKMTAAHNDDISHRKVAKDGAVYRNYERVSINVKR